MNSQNFITIDDKVFAFDLKRLFEILADGCPADTSKEKIKTEEWGYNPYDEECKEFKMLHKESSERVNNDKETFASVKYDLYKNLMQMVLNPTVDEDGNISQVTSLSDLYFGQAIAFNTMLNDGIIIEIN